MNRLKIYNGIILLYKIAFAAFIFLLTLPGVAQETLYESMTHDGVERTYILYVPELYDPGEETPLILNFHGYGSNSDQQMIYGNFRLLADTFGFLVVHPMGTLDENAQPYWNAQWGGETDDVGFTEALLDEVSTAYNVDQSRVYATGMSNGGFMSYTLACNLSHRIAAIASVTGTMTVEQVDGTLQCLPQHPMPVLQIHGTADATVPYNGNNDWMAPIEDVMDFWVSFNNCTMTPVISAVPDIVPGDGSTVEHFVYAGGNNGVRVELFKVDGGGHTWPGTLFGFGSTNYDINASNEIWRFFSEYDINGRISTTSTNELYTFSQLELYPNPAINDVQVTWKDEGLKILMVGNELGQVLQSLDVTGDMSAVIRMSSYNAGTYFIYAMDSQGRVRSTHQITRL